MTVQRVSSGAPWERVHGYCRAVRNGAFVAVSGTTAVGDDGAIVAPEDAYLQAQRCIEIIRRALEDCGAELSDVVRTRIYLTHIDDWQAVSKAHAEAFGDHPPASTMLETARLIDPAMRLEMEADAIVSD
ncbi:MAG: RidA family protein [Pseudomonadota bacterium]